MTILNNSQIQILKDSIRIYGRDCQLEQVQEEAMELALAIRKYERAKKKVAYTTIDEIIKRKKELFSEIADNIIMLEQSLLIFFEDREEILKQIDFKLKRQRERLDEKIKTL